MKLPRDLSGDELAQALPALGYEPVHQSGSHVKPVCQGPKRHHLAMPRHKALRVGTLSDLLAEVARIHGLTREELLELLFGK